MRTMVGVLFISLLFAYGCASSESQKEAQKPGAIIMSNVATVTATVEEIDYPTRNLTLRGPEGNAITVKADERVKNLDQVKVGDQVVAEYVESVALFVQKPELGAIADETRFVKVAARGEKPGAIAVATQEIRATVEAIDYENRLVTLRGPRGNAVTLRVDESVVNFKNVKQGDEVVARHTEAMAINVRKP